ncbi:hypothetical protein [Aurantimonas marianensis]|uniref:Uncharacterized protein n=1 Tax=Aurantimonas marianensis TaxID=2920428 RepID=A0A9X2HB45_9HYPH|nr:hypothetical protein [Aurantimonas marianensis]MCP3056493.1 hypothetical protein [Aurantimonas marianensis]
MPAKRLPLPKRFSVALTEEAYDRLRALNSGYGLSNNYLLTVLLSRLDDYADPDRLARVFDDFISEYGAPSPGGMGAHKPE